MGKEKKIKKGITSRAICSLVKKDFHNDHTEDYKSLVEKPKYVCKKCGHVAGSKDNLCKASKL